MMETEEIIRFIRQTFHEEGFIPLHAPYFGGNEKKYLIEAIDSTFVSSVGAFVDRFEKELAEFTGSGFGVACVNGTNALHMAMLVCGVKEGDEVLSQPLTFIATANAISYIGAVPVFIDVDRDSLGMSPHALKEFLVNNAIKNPDGFTCNKISGRRIRSCIPMHTFGLPCRVDELAEICEDWNITLIEDAAESIGSFYKNKHTGTFGRMGVFSFNGNKTITCGGGGALITDDEELAKKAKHLTTQAKIPHPWRYRHDAIGYNYRMPNLNAALICAQMEQLEGFVKNKRELATMYENYFQGFDVKFISEIECAHSNYWLNAILFPDRERQEQFLEKTNKAGVMTRPIWDLMTTMSMFKDYQNDGVPNSRWLADRIANIPSSYRPVK